MASNAQAPIKIQKETNVLSNIQSIKNDFSQINFSSQRHLVFKTKKVNYLVLILKEFRHRACAGERDQERSQAQRETQGHW